MARFSIVSQGEGKITADLAAMENVSRRQAAQIRASVSKKMSDRTQHYTAAAQNLSVANSKLLVGFANMKNQGTESLLNVKEMMQS